MLSENEPKVKSLGKALNVLGCFTSQNPVWGVTELAAHLNLGKSNVHNILDTFAENGYLRRTEDGRYTLGLRMLEYAFVINQNLGYPNAIYDILVWTSQKAGEVVYFGVPYGKKILYLYVAHPPLRMSVRPYRDMLGETAPLFSTGIGKAILANLPEEEWDDHLPEVLEPQTPNTITDRDALKEELRYIRLRGYARDNQEHERDTSCVAVPIFNASGSLVAGMSISGRTKDMTDEKISECQSLLASAARQIKERIYH